MLTYFSIFSFLSLGFFFCELLLSLLSLGRLLSPGFVFLKARKSGCHSHSPSTQSTLQSVGLSFRQKCGTSFTAENLFSQGNTSYTQDKDLAILPNTTADLQSFNEKSPEGLDGSKKFLEGQLIAVLAQVESQLAPLFLQRSEPFT